MPYPTARSQYSSLALSVSTNSDLLEYSFELCTTPTTTMSGPQKSSQYFPESPTDISPPLSPVEYPTPAESPSIPPLPPTSSPSTGTRRLFPNATRSIFLGTSRASSIRAALEPRARAQTVDVTPLRAVRFKSNSSTVQQVDVRVVTPGISDTWRRRNFPPRRNATMPLPSLSNIKEVDEGRTQDIQVLPHAAVSARRNAPNTSHPPVAAQNPTHSLGRSRSSSWGDVRVSASAFAHATGAEELEELDDEVREALYVNAALRARGFAYEPAPNTNTKTVKRTQTLPVISSTKWHSSAHRQSDHVLAIRSEVDEMLCETQKIKSSPSFRRTAPVRSSPLAKTPPLNISDVPSSSATQRKPLRQARSVPNLRDAATPLRANVSARAEQKEDREQIQRERAGFERWVRGIVGAGTRNLSS
ncbi:hypothetical protein C8F01DRAFT_216321 [Mycena amicta]|nr:hypothetical protein C8F01DRAFT_216321 [Mycena amicta]